MLSRQESSEGTDAPLDCQERFPKIHDENAFLEPQSEHEQLQLRDLHVTPSFLSFIWKKKNVLVYFRYSCKCLVWSAVLLYFSYSILSNEAVQSFLYSHNGVPLILVSRHLHVPEGPSRG